MEFYCVVYRKFGDSQNYVKVFYDFDDACKFADVLCKSGFDQAMVTEVLRDYFDDMSMVEYFTRKNKEV